MMVLKLACPLWVTGSTPPFHLNAALERHGFACQSRRAIKLACWNKTQPNRGERSGACVMCSMHSLNFVVAAEAAPQTTVMAASWHKEGLRPRACVSPRPAGSGTDRDPMHIGKHPVQVPSVYALPQSVCLPLRALAPLLPMHVLPHCGLHVLTLCGRRLDLVWQVHSASPWATLVALCLARHTPVSRICPPLCSYNTAWPTVRPACAPHG
jgi:hypothetical protein